MPDELREVFDSIINMDGPRHARLRRIVSKEFTPRRLALLQGSVERIAGEIIDDISARGSCDVVDDISSKLPLRIICDMMGIPASEYKFVLKCTNVMLGAFKPEYFTSGTGLFAPILQAARELAELMQQICALRINNPQDDVTSILVNAEIDGQRLTARELASFFVLLVSTGNETTRNAISWGVWLLSQHPAQRAALAEDSDGLIAGAVEEIFRWSSPIIYMRRTLAASVELSGQLLESGAKSRYFTGRPTGTSDTSPTPIPLIFGVALIRTSHSVVRAHISVSVHISRVGRPRSCCANCCVDCRICTPPNRFLIPSMMLNGIKHLPAVYTPRNG